MPPYIPSWLTLVNQDLMEKHMCNAYDDTLRRVKEALRHEGMPTSLVSDIQKWCTA